MYAHYLHVEEISFNIEIHHLTLEAGHLAGATALGAVTGHVTVLIAFEASHLGFGWTVAFGVALLF